MDVVDRIYGGYGENAGGGMRAGKQARMMTEGNAHLDRDFPKLDRLIRASVLAITPVRSGWTRFRAGLDQLLRELDHVVVRLHAAVLHGLHRLLHRRQQLHRA